MLRDDEHQLEYVDDYLHGVLAPRDAETVERHCQACRICRVALEEAERRIAVLRSFAPAEVSERLIQRTLAGVESYASGAEIRRRRAITGFWSSLAAAAALLGFAHLHFAHLKPSPVALRVLGQTSWLPDSMASLAIRLVNPDSGDGLKDVPIEVELVGRGSQRVRLASFRTDKWGNGRPRFRVPDWGDGGYELRISTASRGISEQLSKQVKLQRSWQLMLTSDKPVYQPGQTIHLRSLALRRPDQKPVAGTEIAFAIRDPKGNLLFKERTVTSKFGIASTDCLLAAEIMQGLYEVDCQIGDTTSRLSVDVRHYALPKFSIQTELDRTFYRPGEVVHGKVDARYFFGKPVQAAEVSVTAETTEVTKRELAKTKVTTDESGGAAFSIQLPDAFVGREQDSKDARFDLSVTVIDTAGQSHTEKLSRLVTNRPLQVTVVPEGGKLVRGVKNRVYLLAAYADGRPAKTRVAISGHSEELTTDESGLAEFVITPEQDEKLLLRITDFNGLTATEEVSLAIGQPADDYLVRLDRAVCTGGEPLHVSVFGAGREPVFIDLIKDHQTMLTETVQLTDGVGQLAIDLPPELAGGVELCTYRFDRDGVAVRKSRAIYVRPAHRLNLRLAPDQPEYRPGGKVRLNVTLSDQDGRGQVGAVSLAGVDEAVFSVSDSGRTRDAVFSKLEEELLRPVYEIHDWHPMESFGKPPGKQAQLEQALFSRTWNFDPREEIERALRASGDSGIDIRALSERPDRERLIGALEPEQQARVSKVLTQPSSHTLESDSFPAKQRQIESLARRGLAAVRPLWFLLGLFAVVGGVVWLLSQTQSVGTAIAEVLVLLMVLGCLSALLLPAVNSAREAGRLSMARNQMRQLGMAMSQSPSALKSAGTDPPRVRQWFPETLLWRPEVITDDNGQASIEFDVADSITTWRVTGSAVSVDGAMGAAETPLRVFQPFFVDLDLPPVLTRGDEVAVKAVVYNYLQAPQSVELQLADASWFELVGDDQQKLELKPGEVLPTYFRLRAKAIGDQQLEVTARSEGLADAVRRPIQVVADGHVVERTQNGSLAGSVDLDVSVPIDAIEGSVAGVIKLYPSKFSQVVEGLDGIFQRPYGCFEQTSSTTYPNALALEYLRRMKLNAPEVELKARQYLHLGYQRLLGFEVPGGGFDWFGNPPASLVLTAYGLAEFSDMARVMEVDPALIARTREFLLRQQQFAGNWLAEGRALHDGMTNIWGQSGFADVATTAYVASAVFAGQPSDAAGRRAQQYLSEHVSAESDDPYLLALVADALLSIDPDSEVARRYLGRLVELKQQSDDGKLVWWTTRPDGRTLFFGSGSSGGVEATSLVTLAMLKANSHSEVVMRSLDWLLKNRDQQGTWGTTQATVMALKALLAASDSPRSTELDRRILVELDGTKLTELVVPAQQSDVVQQFDLSKHLSPGAHRLQLRDPTNVSSGFQFVQRHNVPGTPEKDPAEPLAIEISYDRAALEIGDVVNATATLTNRQQGPLPMVIADLPIPPGFALESSELDGLVTNGTLAKYQVNPRSAVVYLRSLAPKAPIVIKYRLRALLPVRATVPPAAVYEYYNPANRGTGVSTTVVVEESQDQPS